jgi:DNA-binding CsgD family transcriptional regulator
MSARGAYFGKIAPAVKASPPDAPLSLAVFDAALHRIYSATEPETFPEKIMPLLLEVTRSQCAGLCANALLPGDPFIAIAFSGRPKTPKWQQYPQVSFHDHPSFRYAATPAPPHPIRLTDHFPNRAALEATRYYQDLLRPIGMRYEVTLLLDTPLGQRLGISVARVHNDYRDDEVDVLSRLGPHLQRAFHHAQTLAQLKGAQGKATTWREVALTPRESEILRWAATGRTNASIAEILGVGPATVKTHLEHIFVKLGVKNRAAAVAALRDLPPPERA